MNLVYICSPLRGDIERNISNAHSYYRYAVELGAIPIAPHTIYTNYLSDLEPSERRHGLMIGLEILLRCDEVWVLGSEITEGMEAEIKLAQKRGIPIYQIHAPENILCSCNIAERMCLMC